MGRTIGHISAVGGLVLPVISEIVSVSQSHGFKWNWLSVLALVLFVLYVSYAAWYVGRGRKAKVTKAAEEAAQAERDATKAAEDAATAAKDAARKEARRTGYRLLVTVGNHNLKNLESCMMNMCGGSQSQDQMNHFVQFVNNEIRKCAEWQRNAESEVEQWDEQVGKTLLKTHAVRRPRPNYLGNGTDSQMWERTAGYLDWLTEELNKL